MNEHGMSLLSETYLLSLIATFEQQLEHPDTTVQAAEGIRDSIQKLRLAVELKRTNDLLKP